MIYKGQFIDLVPVLETWGITGWESSDNFNALCPFHNDVNNPSFSINTKNGLWLCFAGCGKGNFTHFLERMGKTLDDIEYVEDIHAPMRMLDMLAGRDQVVPVREILATAQEDYSAQQDSKFAKWVFDRGFTPEILRKNAFKYDIERRALVMPIFDEDGTLVGVCRRYSPSMTPRRYHYTRGFDASRYIYGLPHVKGCGTIGLSEGILDAVWLAEAGLPSVAFFGSYISDDQLSLLAQVDAKELVLAFDNDAAGDQAAERVMEHLGSMFDVSFLDFDNAKDAQSISLVELSEIIVTRTNHLIQSLHSSWEDESSTVAAVTN